MNPGDLVRVVDPAAIAARSKDGDVLGGIVTRVDQLPGGTIYATFKSCGRWSGANVEILQVVDQSKFRWRRPG